MNAIFRALAVALCCATTSLAETPAATALAAVASTGANFVSVPADSGFKAGMSFKIDDGTNSEVREITAMIANAFGNEVSFKDALEHTYGVGTAFEYFKVTTTPEVIADKPKPTTTLYWDSSASFESSSGSLSSASLASSNSGSLHDGSSGSDSFNSASSGSTASGSSGSFLQLWQWVIVLALVCVICLGARVATAKPKKAKKSKKATPPPAEPEAVFEVPELQPLFMPQLMPISSGLTYAAPMTTSYATPLAQSTVQYAMPATTAYTTAPAIYAQPGGVV